MRGYDIEVLPDETAILGGKYGVMSWLPGSMLMKCPNIQGGMGGIKLALKFTRLLSKLRAHSQ